MSTTVFVGDLSYFCEEKDLLGIFSAFGPVSSIIVRRGKEGNSLQYAFVIMNEPDAYAACDALNGSKFMGRKMRMNISTAKQQRCTPLDCSAWFQLHVRFKINTLSVQLNEMLLEEIFAPYGPVADCTIKEYNVNLDLRSVSGYAFVYYYTVDIANDAILSVNQNNGYWSEVINFRCNFAYEVKDGYHDDFDMPVRQQQHHFTTSYPLTSRMSGGRQGHGKDQMNQRIMSSTSGGRGYSEQHTTFGSLEPLPSHLDNPRMAAFSNPRYTHPSTYDMPHPQAYAAPHRSNSSYDPYSAAMKSSALSSSLYPSPNSAGTTLPTRSISPPQSESSPYFSSQPSTYSPSSQYQNFSMINAHANQPFGRNTSRLPIETPQSGSRTISGGFPFDYMSSSDAMDYNEQRTLSKFQTTYPPIPPSRQHYQHQNQLQLPPQQHHMRQPSSSSATAASLSAQTTMSMFESRNTAAIFDGPTVMDPMMLSFDHRLHADQQPTSSMKDEDGVPTYTNTDDHQGRASNHSSAANNMHGDLSYNR